MIIFDELGVLESHFIEE
jgi:vacuolar protein sorting-associated protein 35